MTSLLIQNYTNFHIVFLDDNSDDGNLQRTKEFLDINGFPRNRVTYVQNLERKYASYNLVHAGQSYCGDKDIQIMLDGDDSYIGKQPLQIFNAVYQNNKDIWVAYSNYFSDKYTYGESKPINYGLDDENGKRKIGHFIGLIRSWYAKLIKLIPLKYHQYQNGSWLTSMTDDAMQYSLYELAGNDRILYIPEILHLYSMDYGDNIYSSKSREKLRRETHIYITSLERNKKL